MNIVILGAGEVGEYLCQYLSVEGYNIVLIDNDGEKLQRIMNNNDILAIQGDGTDINILHEADIEKAAIFIAVAQNDEINIVSSLIAKKLGAKYSIARIRNPNYAKYEKIMGEILNIDLIINPEFESAKEIIKILKFPNVAEVEYFSKGLASLISLKIRNNDFLNGIKLEKLYGEDYKDILIPLVIREREAYIPKGDFVLQENDTIYCIGENKALRNFMNNIPFKDSRNIMILGGGIITYYLLEDLYKSNYHVKVIEKDKKKAEDLSFNYPKADIICADGTNQDILEEERISNFDVLVSLMDIDEENIISSIYAKQIGLDKLFTKVNMTNILRILALKDIGTVITPKKLTMEIIIKFIKSHLGKRSSKIETLYRLADDKVEAIEFEIDNDSNILNIPIKKLYIKKDTIIVFIIRNNKFIIPSGDDYLQLKDKVVVITLDKYFVSIEDILE